MRFSEFKLLETTLQRSSTSSWENYLTNLVQAKSIALGKTGERDSGLELSDKSKEAVKELIGQFKAAENKIEFAKEIEEFVVTFTNKKTAPIKHIHKSAEITGKKSSTGSEKKPWNEGEVAETILGAALYARFISKKNINENDVWSALKTFTQNPTSGGFRIVGTKRNGKSEIDMVAINKPINNEIVNKLVTDKKSLEKDFPKGVEALQSKISACAAYVNESDKVIKALEEADQNPGAPIIIKTDGVGNQKGTKADLRIEIGKWKQLLSLKVNDVKQFGQESGSSGLVVSSFFKRFMPDLDLSDLYMKEGQPVPWAPQTGEGWPDMDSRKAVKELKQSGLWDAALDQVYRLTGSAYQRASAHLQEKLSTEDGAASVVKNIYNGIIHHAQGTAQFQTLVILNPSTKAAWKELEFGPSLELALGNYKLEVEVEVGKRGVSNHKLKIYGTPITPEAQVAAQTQINTDQDAEVAKQKADLGKVTPVAKKELLFQLRSYQQESGNMRNPVEMGTLLKNLTEVQKIENASVDDAENENPPAPQAVAVKKPAPTVKEPLAQQTTANTPVQPIYGKSVNTLQGTTFAPDNEPSVLDEPVRETGESPVDKDLERIKELSRIVSHMSRNS